LVRISSSQSKSTHKKKIIERNPTSKGSMYKLNGLNIS